MLVGVGAALFVLVLSRIIWWSVAQRLPHSGFETQAAAFGDIAGAVFSAFAFAGLIVTALMQREELSLQRKELRETRAELKRTADAQEAAEKALQAQVTASQNAARLNAYTVLINIVNDDLNFQSNRGNPYNAASVERRRNILQDKVEAILNSIDSVEG